MISDPFEVAFNDYLGGKNDASILVHCNKGDDELIPISYFFRSFSQMPQIEQLALKICEGKVLDIGAGSGSHSLILKERGIDVTSLDIKPGFVKIMQERGLNNTIQSDILNYKYGGYDTLLMLMNGIGFTKNFKGLSAFLKQAKGLLNKGGQLIFDSSDLLYIYQNDDRSYLINLNDNYYGEVEYVVEYNGLKGAPFEWLYIDFGNLSFIAEESGFKCELLMEDDHYNYLARLF